MVAQDKYDSYFVLIILKYVIDTYYIICTNNNQLSCQISDIRHTNKVWEQTMTKLKYFFYFFVHPLDSIRIFKLQLLDYKYMYIHDNPHNQLN